MCGLAALLMGRRCVIAAGGDWKILRNSKGGSRERGRGQSECLPKSVGEVSLIVEPAGYCHVGHPVARAR
jgi:hypothetical protein